MCSVDSNIYGYECVPGQVTYSGKNNVKLVYKDIAGQILSSNSNADFSDTLISQYIVANSKVQLDSVVVDADTTINGNIVTLQLSLDVGGSIYACDSVPMLLEGEQLYVHHNHAEVVSGVDNMILPCDLSCQLTASQDITRVIMADCKVGCSDYVLLDGVLTLSGDMVVGMMYMSGDKVVYDQLTSPYRTELECPMAGGQLSILPAVKNARIKLDILEGELNNVFSSDVSVSMAVTSVICQPVSMIDDCYTANSTLELDRVDVATTLPCGAVSARAHIEQNIASADLGEVIAFVNVASTVTNCRYLEGLVSVEGIISGTVLYSSTEGIASTVIELPFVENVDIDYIASSCSGSAIATVLSSSCSYSQGMLLVRAEVVIDIFSRRTVKYGVICGINEKMLDVGKSSGIEVCMAKSGETLWQLAKALHMSEQDILDINPDIVSPLERDTKIVIYNRL